MSDDGNDEQVCSHPAERSQAEMLGMVIIIRFTTVECTGSPPMAMRSSLSKVCRQSLSISSHFVTWTHAQMRFASFCEAVPPRVRTVESPLPLRQAIPGLTRLSSAWRPNRCKSRDQGPSRWGNPLSRRSEPDGNWLAFHTTGQQEDHRAWLCLGCVLATYTCFDET